MPRRWWLFRPLDLLARLWPVGRRRGVLMVRIDGIGDMAMFQGAFAHYSAALGVAVSEITLLGCQSWASLAPQFFPGCRFFAIDEHAYERNPLYRFKISLWVRRQGFAVAICDMYLRRPLVADALLWVSGAPERIATNPHSSPRTAAVFSWYLQRCTRTIDTGPIQRTRSSGISAFSRRSPGTRSGPRRRRFPGPSALGRLPSPMPC